MKLIHTLKCATVFGLMLAIASTAMAQQAVDTRIGKLEFTHDWKNGYPTDETVTKLYDELDFQRAVQAYIWAIPIVSAANWLRLDEQDHGFELGDIIIRSSFDERLGMLTINNDTFYSAFDVDLGQHGPVVIEIPKGINARGSALDMWQRPITAMTKPGKYLFLPDGADEPAGADGFEIHKSQTNGIIVAIRLFAKTDKEKEELSKKVLVYPFSQKDNPPSESNLIHPDTSPFSAPPRGMMFWSILADAVNSEPVAERDRLMMGMLKPLGIEKGRAFWPDARQTMILTEAALVGEAMAKTIQGARRMPQAVYREGSNWEIATTASPDQRTEFYDQIDGRAAWFYEAVLNNKAMTSTKPGKTQVYLGAYKDKDGDRLDGGTNYVINVPANPPAETFWSVTIYDVSHRTLIATDQKKPTVGTNQDHDNNADGSITIYVGPDAPKGKEKNWIKTIPGQAWFSYFRLYSPTEPFFDGSWILPDFEKSGKVMTATAQETVDTRIGKLDFTHDFANGYPADATIEKLYGELDFQRAVQTYIWAIPFVSQAQMRHMYLDIFEASTGSIVILDTFERRHGYLTANNDTFYATAWANMGADGPVVVDLPAGINARGAAHDMWWIEIGAMTKPGKYLFVPPGTKVPADASGYTVFEAPHNNFLIALRLFDKTDEAKLATTKKIKIYPYSKRKDAPAIRIVYADKPHFSAQPRGMDYWRALAGAIDREPVAERDRFFMAYLASLGIEKGKAFEPDARQARILTEGAEVGEMMTKTIQGARRMPQALYHEGSHWEVATTANPDQRTEFYDQIDGRAAWLYEAVLNNKAMHSYKPGKTQVYLGAYKDKDGDWLDGGTNYVLNVPANPPAETFWSATIYDVNMRTLIKTDQKKPTVGSVQGFDKNADGSVSIYVGPDAPKGKERNWIKTIPGQGWFSYFRLYSPTEPFFDGSWVLPDFEKMK